MPSPAPRWTGWRLIRGKRPRYANGSSTAEPVVRRSSTARCASAASRSGKAVADLDRHRPRRYDVEQIRGRSLQILALLDIVHERRPGDEQRAARAQFDDIHRVGRARGMAVARHDAERAQAIERAGEGVLADALVNHRAALAVGHVHDQRHEILARINRDMIGAVGFGEFGFLVGRDRADHGCAQMFGPLAQDQPHAAGRRVDQHRIARLHPVGAAQQVLRGQALERHAGGGFLGDAVRQPHHSPGRHHPALRIGAVRRAGVGDPVADRAFGDAVADRLHRARALDADDER